MSLNNTRTKSNRSTVPNKYAKQIYTGRASCGVLIRYCTSYVTGRSRVRTSARRPTILT